MPRSSSIGLAVLAAACLTAGCGSSGYAPTNLTTAAGPPTSAAPVRASAVRPPVVVSISGLAFRPPTITTTVGRGVEWVNRDSVAHNVTTLDGTTIASPDLRPGRRFVYVPARPGRLRYYCTIHPSTMSGVVIVKPA